MLDQTVKNGTINLSEELASVNVVIRNEDEAIVVNDIASQFTIFSTTFLGLIEKHVPKVTGKL